MARTALAFARPSASVLPVLVNGAAGALILIGGRPQSLLAFTVSGGKIVEIDGVADPERLNQLDVRTLGG